MVALFDRDIGTRAEHLAWCKDRALMYLDSGDITQAMASFASDLNKHSETAGHPAPELMLMHAMSGLLDAKSCRDLIEGAN